MLSIKNASKNFDGIKAIMIEEEFDSIMYCLDYSIGLLVGSATKLVEQCKKLQRVLTSLAYFDAENREVHIQLSYSELEILTTAIYLVLPSGESDHSFANCIKNPNTKLWISKEE